jgi:peptidoglycan hydrolase-like protein with peptidoglycan-binding domain
MRKILTFAAALAMSALAWAQAPATPSTPARKAAAAPAVRKTPAKSAAATSVRKAGTASSTAAARRPASKKAPAVHTTWRTRQNSPTPDRYREIQDALVAKGYLAAEEANGTWGSSSADALKKFQAEQTLETTGKIDSLSLIALGLGPKHDSGPVMVVDGNAPLELGRN